MSKTTLILLGYCVALLSGSTVCADDSSTLGRYKTPEEAGFDSAQLAAAYDYYLTLRPGFASNVVLYKGKILVEWGDSSTHFYCHSVRKSFLSALYGIHVANGTIDLNATLAELGIDDDPPLTDAEKLARVVHLLKARSGVYHAAAAETPDMRAQRPARGSHGPDEFWYYNNWDFNALGTIFRQRTGKDIFAEFKAQIADPIGMQDFSPAHCNYAYEYEYSTHPAYVFRMSGRDRARFGQLFLDEGVWNGKQIIPANWVRESTAVYSDASANYPGLGYGYMWWTLPGDAELLKNYPHLTGQKVVFASGLHGNVIQLFHGLDLVNVIVADSDHDYYVGVEESALLLEMILAAKTSEINDLQFRALSTSSKRTAPGAELKLTATLFNDGNDATKPAKVVLSLLANKGAGGKSIRLGTVTIRSIAANKAKTYTLRVTVPVGVKPGKYRLQAIVDPENVNGDPDLSDNAATSLKTIVVK